MNLEVFNEEGRVKADFNNDGISDLLWREAGTGNNGIWITNDVQDDGSVGFQAQVSIDTEVNPNWAISGVGDFNGNGTEDIVWRNFETGANGVWLMNGVERRAIRTIEAENNTNWYIGGVGDANEDGNPDLFWRNSSNGNNGIWYLNEDLSVIAKVDITTEDNTNWEMVAVDHMNDDGTPDIIWRNRETGSNGVWLMGGDAGQEVSEVVSLEEELNPNWTIRGTGDFNGDGNADLVWRNVANGNNGVWLYDGDLNRRATVSFETQDNTAWQIVQR